MPDRSMTAADLRRFVVTQYVGTVVFCLIVFWLFGATSGDLPPWWLVVVLLALVVVGAVVAERLGREGNPLDPEVDEATTREKALEVFARLTLKSFVATEVPLLLAAVVCFGGTWSAWPLALVFVPAFAVIVWETWPHPRRTAAIEAMLDASGARSGLTEQFRPGRDA